ncbi:SDR family NAD(P)-dependent oxidoreductase [Sphingomonas sp. UV9]|uniref:SDR family oxidoreductase n=1 Tax=Sphingomonas sp. UV9 TaxID=1851410 RepID=UPI000FFC9B8B|nr:SDR family oxidoreductase [Sphingomonas sp. UV9]RXD03823.1 SDR family NAD(P)-dependent oxidoreductase [Sphingomonas sp. UV9]
MKRTGNTILITGGGSGIGEALAQRFHDLGNTVIIAGRRQDALDTAIEGRVGMHAVTVDVEDPAAITAFARTVTERFPALNVLINNAGIMRRETVDTARDLADAEAMIVTNVLGPIRMIDALVDHLVARPDSVIVNVTSGLSFVPLTVAPTYSATKAAVHSYTISLREVLKGKVEVIELAPPGVQTELTPGQATRPGYQPLEEFADEVLALFEAEPTPAEILVQRVRPLRFAERDEQMDTLLAKVNAAANPE